MSELVIAKRCKDCREPHAGPSAYCPPCWRKSPLVSSVTALLEAAPSPLYVDQVVVIVVGARERQVARIARPCTCNTPGCTGYFVWAADFGRRDVLTYYERHELARLDGVGEHDLPRSREA